MKTEDKMITFDPADPLAQDLLAEYASRLRGAGDAARAEALEADLREAGYDPASDPLVRYAREALQVYQKSECEPNRLGALANMPNFQRDAAFRVLVDARSRIHERALDRLAARDVVQQIATVLIPKLAEYLDRER
jgi:hypothetical protein